MNTDANATGGSKKNSHIRTTDECIYLRGRRLLVVERTDMANLVSHERLIDLVLLPCRLRALVMGPESTAFTMKVVICGGVGIHTVTVV